MDLPISFDGPPRTLDVTMRVLDRATGVGYITDAGIVFVRRDEDTDLVATEVTISIEDWEAFGSPEKITVAITPGDTLNS